MLKIVHISDTHGFEGHSKLNLPECDVLIHSGDAGGRTTLAELTEFLIWLEKQPARLKIFVAGNHDICLDKNWGKDKDSIVRMLHEQKCYDAKKLIEGYNIKYLENKDYIFEGIKFYGSPYSPTFGVDWAFNADRGEEINKQWSKIPSDVNVLITHTPVYGILDHVDERYKRYPNEDMNVGCKNLFEVIKKRMFNLKLHCSGHIHAQYGVVLKPISHTRNVLFSNGSVLNNDYEQLITNPLIISL